MRQHSDFVLLFTQFYVFRNIAAELNLWDAWDKFLGDRLKSNSSVNFMLQVPQYVVNGIFKNQSKLKMRTPGTVN